ncbi:MAG TPA: IS256 family transposase [Solirubrobacteraceae bacterium]|nr:IS256 family transposase [Solirubrobacteraceae bacterium]
MGKTVSVAQATCDEGVLPERVQEALGRLVGAAREGLLALSVEVGLGVLQELLEEEVVELVGPKGKWNPDRTAVRHGHEDGEVTLGGRRVKVRRPRARTADGEAELPLSTYEHFSDRDPLEGVVLERMLAGVSTRKYRRAQEPVGEQVEADARATSKSAASRMFVRRTTAQLWKLMNRPLSDLRLAVVMLDGIELHGRTNIVALGITTEGDKLALGLWDGSTENATVAAALLADVVDRGLDVEQGLLFVIDGSKGLRKAIRQVFGNDVPVQRCVVHKQRNVLDHLPERDRPAVKTRLRRAWKETSHDRALEQLTSLALELDHAHPGAAASLREGMEETLTVTRLGITGKLKLTLQSTNPCESMISTVRVIHRNVKNWSSGDMCLRWTAAGMLEAETRFRKVEGYRGLAGLAVKIEHDLLHKRQLDGHTSTKETRTAGTV